MPTYRKKPVEVEAIQYDGSNVVEIALFGAMVFETNALAWDYGAGAYRYPGGKWAFTGEGGMHPNCLLVPTLEGDMLARPGDWIIKGVQGEFYPCKSDIFEATYERVADDERTDPVSEVRGDEAP